MTGGRAFAVAATAVLTIGFVLPYVLRASHNPDEGPVRLERRLLREEGPGR